MKAKFIIETSHPDSSQTTINFKGLAILDKTYILRDYETDKILGHADLVFEGENLLALADIEDEGLDLYPAISLQIIKEHYEGEQRVIDLSRLFSVGLSHEPNTNPNIKTVREQVLQNYYVGGEVKQTEISHP